jgi:hypothetical protein
MSIITFNANRLRELCHYLIELHERYRKRMSFRSKLAQHGPSISSQQLAIVLEFFLQMDGTHDRLHVFCR